MQVDAVKREETLNLKRFLLLQVDDAHLLDQIVALVGVKEVHDVALRHDVIDERFALGALKIRVGDDEDAALVVARRSHQRTFERFQPITEMPEICQ